MSIGALAEQREQKHRLAILLDPVRRGILLRKQTVHIRIEMTMLHTYNRRLYQIISPIVHNVVLIRFPYVILGRNCLSKRIRANTTVHACVQRPRGESSVCLLLCASCGVKIARCCRSCDTVNALPCALHRVVIRKCDDGTRRCSRWTDPGSWAISHLI
jgi:hypothetical protein